jgi:putative transposase
MTAYRRHPVPGGTYFFTVNLLNRKDDTLTRRIGALRDAMREARIRLPFHIDACVVLPEHLHCVWTLPEGDADYSQRWHAIKAGFSQRLPPGEARSASRAAKGERGIWQRRFWEHTIRDDRDYAVHVDYVHFNPVRHRLVSQVADWPYSTFHQMVARGFYPADWNTEPATMADAGERAET